MSPEYIFLLVFGILALIVIFYLFRKHQIAVKERKNFNILQIVSSEQRGEEAQKNNLCYLAENKVTRKRTNCHQNIQSLLKEIGEKRQ